MNNTYEIINVDNITINSDMQYYIDYAKKLNHLECIELLEDPIPNRYKYVSVKSKNIYNLEYEYFVAFNQQGKFIKGMSYLLNSKQNYKYVEDQFKFKQKIKKEINKINVIHGTIINLLKGMNDNE